MRQLLPLSHLTAADTTLACSDNSTRTHTHAHLLHSVQPGPAGISTHFAE